MTQRKTYRMHQINRQLKEEIASILLMELKNDILRDLTITEVRTTKDLQQAVVFITTHRSTPYEEAMNAANKSAGYIRKLLFNRLRLRHIPTLEFRYDDSLDRAERIFQKLNEIDLPESPGENE